MTCYFVAINPYQEREVITLKHLHTPLKRARRAQNQVPNLFDMLLIFFIVLLKIQKYIIIFTEGLTEPDVNITMS